MILKISVTLHYKLLSPITLAPLSLLLLTAALAPPSALLLLTTTLTPTVLLLLTTTMATSVAYCCCYQLLWSIPQHCLLLKGLAQAKIIKKSVILFRVLNMTI